MGASLTVEDLAVLELANVAHANLITTLGSPTGTDLAVIDLHTLDDLDAGSGGRLLALLGDRGASGALLQVLGELDLLLRLWCVLLSGNSLALVVLELLGFLLAELALLGDQLIQALGGILGSALVLTLLGLDQLGNLLLICIDLLDTASAINVVQLVLGLVADELIELGGQVVLVVIGVLILTVGGLVLVDNVVTRDVDGVRAGIDEESLLLLTNSKLQRLLVVLWSC